MKIKNSFKNFGSVLLVVLAASCSPKQTNTVGTADTVTIRGSNTIGEELAPRLIAEFKKDHPNVNFDLEFKGTSYGLGALMVERCDVAAASRNLTTNEMELAKDRNIAFNDYVIGSYSVDVIVNAGNPVTNFSLEQVRDVFVGAITNWSAVGGPDAPLHLYARDPISGTHLGFQELAMEKKPYAPGFKTFTNYAAIVQSVAKDANGIGYSSIDLPKTGGVKAISIGGVAPTVESINKGKYPYARVLRLHTNKAQESPATHDFVQFVQSKRGQEIISQMGFAPAPAP
ncbi:MAG: PstS family phosphate ABC transporter substrate-binding protein [Verrucomicrobiota bacterium]